MKIVKTLVVIFVLLLPVIIFENPTYVELNDLAIIRGVGVSCGKETNLYLKEIIPTKGETGITYQYEYYQGAGKDVSKALEKINLKTKKKLYLSKVKFLVTDCTKSNHIMNDFELKHIKVYHVQDDVLKELKKITNLIYKLLPSRVIFF